MPVFIRRHLPFLILFIALFITGIMVYKDYGISWDEDMQRKDNGLVNYNYIHYNNYEPLIGGNEKYHGPAFEIALIYIEKIFDMKSTREIYLMRHFVVFLVFLLSVLFFYRILYDETKAIWLAFTGTAFLILSPRIFADSFYNSKDLVFMGFMIINIFTTLKFIRKPGFIIAILNALVTALVIDTRVMGVIIPAFTIFIIMYNFIFKSDGIIKYLKPSILYFIFLFGFIVLFWPVLWKDPIHHFIASIREMSHYHWESYLTYLGKNYDTTFIPWHYIPVWILITTPLLYTILFIMGLVLLVRKALKRIVFSEYELLNLLIFLVPLLAVILLKSVVYDGWRHMFFIYPSMIMIAILGLRKVFDWSLRFVNGKQILSGGLIAYCIFIFITMIILHPYENVYFNKIAGNSLNNIRKNFEIDYWGLSYMESMNYILKNDSSNYILYCPTENPGRYNLRIIPDDERIRLSVTNRPEIADYYVTTFRYQHNLEKYNADFNIERNGGVIASVYDFRKDKIVLDEKNSIGKYNYSFENQDTNWVRGNSVNIGNALTGNFVEVLDSNVEYGCAFDMNSSEHFIRPGFRNYVTFSVNVRSDEPLDFRLMLSIREDDNEERHWDGNDYEYYRPGKWTKITWTTLLPKGIELSDKFKFYAWNFRKNKMQLDDASIEFFSVSDDKFQIMRKKYPFAFFRDKN